MPSRLKPDVPDAQTIAIAALSHFATEPAVLGRFFALTGLDPHSLREAAAAPNFAAGVLDFVIADEALLVSIAAEQETTPEAILAARQKLDVPRDDEEDWPPRSHEDWA